MFTQNCLILSNYVINRPGVAGAVLQTASRSINSVIADQHLSVWLLSNPGDKVQILVESMGQICPVVLHLFWTLYPGFENNHIYSNVDLVLFQQS